jgi:hypothetical protein
MLRESLTTLKAYRSGQASESSRPVNHVWIHRLPWKMRFRQSRLYISVIPPVVLGVFVGALGAIMGIGGGFIIVPAMIYLLRMPTNVVMGTSLVQIVALTAVTTVLQATSNHSVDIVLALLLVMGGVVGAQLGVRDGRQAARRAASAAAGDGGADRVPWACCGAWSPIPSDRLQPDAGGAMTRALVKSAGGDRDWPAPPGPRTWCRASARTLSRSPPTIPAPTSWCSAPSNGRRPRRGAPSRWWCAGPAHC